MKCKNECWEEEEEEEEELKYDRILYFFLSGK